MRWGIVAHFLLALLAWFLPGPLYAFSECFQSANYSYGYDLIGNSPTAHRFWPAPDASSFLVRSYKIDGVAGGGTRVTSRLHLTNPHNFGQGSGTMIYEFTHDWPGNTRYDQDHAEITPDASAAIYSSPIGSWEVAPFSSTVLYERHLFQFSSGGGSATIHPLSLERGEVLPTWGVDSRTIFYIDATDESNPQICRRPDFGSGPESCILSLGPALAHAFPGGNAPTPLAPVFKHLSVSPAHTQFADGETFLVRIRYGANWSSENTYVIHRQSDSTDGGVTIPIRPSNIPGSPSYIKYIKDNIHWSPDGSRLAMVLSGGGLGIIGTPVSPGIDQPFQLLFPHPANYPAMMSVCDAFSWDRTGASIAASCTVLHEPIPDCHSPICSYSLEAEPVYLIPIDNPSARRLLNHASIASASSGFGFDGRYVYFFKDWGHLQTDLSTGACFETRRGSAQCDPASAWDWLVGQRVGGITSDDADADCDGILDRDDNCPRVPNLDQTDEDHDGSGDVCDSTEGGIPSGGDGILDSDGDGFLDPDDNCPALFNIDQADRNNNGQGDLCDRIPTIRVLRDGQELSRGADGTYVDTILIAKAKRPYRLTVEAVDEDGNLVQLTESDIFGQNKRLAQMYGISFNVSPVVTGLSGLFSFCLPIHRRN